MPVKRSFAVIPSPLHESLRLKRLIGRKHVILAIATNGNFV